MSPTKRKPQIAGWGAKTANGNITYSKIRFQLTAKRLNRDVKLRNNSKCNSQTKTGTIKMDYNKQ